MNGIWILANIIICGYAYAADTGLSGQESSVQEQDRKKREDLWRNSGKFVLILSAT